MRLRVRKFTRSENICLVVRKFMKEASHHSIVIDRTKNFFMQKNKSRLSGMKVGHEGSHIGIDETNTGNAATKCSL